MDKTVKTIKRNLTRWNLNSDQVLVREKEVREYEVTEVRIKLQNNKTKIEKKERFLRTKTSKILEIPIRKVTIEEIRNIRMSGKPGFLLKRGDDLFYSELTEENRRSIDGLLKETHKCGDHCLHLSAAADEDGGCEKVRNRACYIELYPWIRLGYEVFNNALNRIGDSTKDALYVAKCSHYEDMRKIDKKTISLSEKIQHKKDLEDFWAIQ